MALSVSSPAFVTAGDYVAAVLDSDTTSRMFTTNSYSGGSTTTPPTAAAAAVNPVLPALPPV